MANTIDLGQIADTTSTRILRSSTGSFPVFVGEDAAAPDFVCGGCNTLLIRGIPASEVSSLADMADGIECAVCLTIREIPRQ